MSSLRNCLPRRTHQERSQPEARKRYGLLEKHQDYVKRAAAFHKKEEALQILKVKAAFRNPDEFSFGMVNTRTAGGVHILKNQANKYSPEELMLMKTQDIGYILQKLQSEKKKIERLAAVLQSLDNELPSKHVYYAEDREHAEEILSQTPKVPRGIVLKDVPKHIKRKTAASYRELEERRGRAAVLEKLYMEMAMQKELQKKGKKRKLRDEEIETPTSRPVYKWRSERKR